MEKKSEKTALVIRDGCEGSTSCARDRTEPGRRLVDSVAMAHPYLMTLTGCPDAIEQFTFTNDVNHRASEFALIGQRHPATEL